MNRLIYELYYIMLIILINNINYFIDESFTLSKVYVTIIFKIKFLN